MRISITRTILAFITAGIALTGANSEFVPTNGSGSAAFQPMQDRRRADTNDAKQPWAFGIGGGVLIGGLQAFDPRSICTGAELGLRFMYFGVPSSVFSDLYLEYSFSYRSVASAAYGRFDMISIEGARIGAHFARSLDILSLPTALGMSIGFIHYYPSVTAAAGTNFTYFPGYAIRVPVDIDLMLVANTITLELFAAANLFIHRSEIGTIPMKVDYNFNLEAGLNLWVYLR
ncbi:MAG: hypothetical protein AABZ39_01485 [Spirochaetota bacterium]